MTAAVIVLLVVSLALNVSLSLACMKLHSQAATSKQWQKLAGKWKTTAHWFERECERLHDKRGQP